MESIEKYLDLFSNEGGDAYERRYPASVIGVRGGDGYGHPLTGGCAEKQRGGSAAKAPA